MRRTVELIRVMDTCKAHNVVIITENGPLDWFSPHGELTTTMWAGLAQMESANISNRVKAAYEAIAHVGRWKGGTPPFGWPAAPHESGKGRRLELNPTEAEIVQEAIERVLAGESFRSFCAAVAAQKAEAPQRSATDSKRAQLEQALAILEEDRRRGLYDRPTAAARFRAQYTELIRPGRMRLAVRQPANCDRWEPPGA